MWIKCSPLLICLLYFLQPSDLIICHILNISNHIIRLHLMTYSAVGEMGTIVMRFYFEPRVEPDMANSIIIKRPMSTTIIVLWPPSIMSSKVQSRCYWDIKYTNHQFLFYCIPLAESALDKAIILCSAAKAITLSNVDLPPMTLL